MSENNELEVIEEVTEAEETLAPVKRVGRTRSERRVLRRKHMKRKLRTAKRVLIFPESHYTERVKGKYAKGKVHCSCPICYYKREDNSATYLNARDRRQLARMKSSLNDAIMAD